MPSSLLPSRCDFSSVSISSSSFDFVSKRCSCALSRNFFRFDGAGFLGMIGHLLHYLRGDHATTQIVGQGLVDPNPHELAGRRITFEEYRAIDLRSLRLTSPAHPGGASGNGAFD